MSESTTRLVAKLADAIDYFRMEYDMTYAEVIGSLELLKADIIREAFETPQGGEVNE